MTVEATIEKMNQMRLFGMAHAYQLALKPNTRDSFTPDELLAHLVDAEWDDRQNRKLHRYLKQAKLRYRAAVEQLDFAGKRLDKNLVMRLAKCDWIEKGQGLIITGPTGSGKSFLVCALGNQACYQGFTALYFNCGKLWNSLNMAKADGSYEKLITKIAKARLLILDDFALQPLDSNSRLFMLEILEDRYGQHATAITSQLPADKWHDVIGDQTLADAICDRVLHSSHKISLQEDDSLRKKYAAKLA